MKKLYLTILEKALESTSISDETKEIINIFLLAINDWPDQVLSLEDYELSISKFLNNIPNKNTIEISLHHSDFSKYAWQMESLSQIIMIFEHYQPDITLCEIIDDMRTKLNKHITLEP